jgi:hypothetical protein
MDFLLWAAQAAALRAPADAREWMRMGEDRQKKPSVERDVRCLPMARLPVVSAGLGTARRRQLATGYIR